MQVTFNDASVATRGLAYRGPNTRPANARLISNSHALHLYIAGLVRASRRAVAYAVGSLVLATVMLLQPAAASVPARVNQVHPSAGAPLSQFFSNTGRTVRGAFLDAYNKYGLQAVGYPLTDEEQENGRTVQYFERVRMEYHPEAAANGYGVMFSRLGYDMSKQFQPFARVSAYNSVPGNAYIAETGHSLSEPFLSYWQQHGGVGLFGYPISEPVMQNGYQVQWFERARFEYHPELAGKGQVIELGLLGKAALDKAHGAAPAAPAKAQPASQNKTAPPAAPQVALTGMESWLLNAINEQRAAAGLGAVKLSGPVTEVARSRSTDMATRNYFSHTTPDGAQFFGMLSGRGIEYKYAGEILARNNYSQDQATKVAMDSYMGSAPHKAIIMDGRYNTAGVGYAKSDEDGMHYFTVLFVQQ